jgi:hypothetical protein
MRHAPIEALLRRIERETGRPVPDLAPDLPGVDAKAIIVLRDPGRLGALKSGVVSPLKKGRPNCSEPAPPVRSSQAAHRSVSVLERRPLGPRGPRPFAARNRARRRLLARAHGTHGGQACRCRVRHGRMERLRLRRCGLDQHLPSEPARPHRRRRQPGARAHRGAAQGRGHRQADGCEPTRVTRRGPLSTPVRRSRGRSAAPGPADDLAARP